MERMYYFYKKNLNNSFLNKVHNTSKFQKARQSNIIFVKQYEDFRVVNFHKRRNRNNL